MQMSPRVLSRRSARGFIEQLEPRRLLNAGQLDPSFGINGLATVNFNGPNVLADAVTTIGNQTLVAGLEFNGHDGENGVVVRLNFNGSLDTTFGNNGIVTFHVGGASQITRFTAIAPGPNNTIYAAGTDNFEEGGGFLVVRFLSNGALDPSFGIHGQKIFGFGFASVQSWANAMAIQTDGKIVLVGQEIPLSPFESSHFAVGRLNSNGSMDTSFNGGGTKTYDLGQDAAANAVTIDYSGNRLKNYHYGSIIVAGYLENGFPSKFAAVRITTSGQLDTSFDGNGEIKFGPTNFSFQSAQAVGVQSNGDIVIAGLLGQLVDNNPQVTNFGVARFTPSGQHDLSFGNTGTTGFTEVSFPGGAGADSLLIRPNDSMIVGGQAGTNSALVGLTRNGRLDTSFGTGGKVTTNFGNSNSSASAMAFMGDRIVTAGGGKFDTARYLDTEPTVSVASFIYTASEQGPTPVTFLVTRSQALPYDTEVNFNIGGTATAPTFFALKFHTNDYTLNGMTIPEFGFPAPPPPSVDIPAGQTVALVTLTPVVRPPDGTQTATFSIIPNTFYNISNQNNLTINIVDGNATTLTSTADAYVRDGASAGTNFGTATDLEVKDAGTGFNRVSYIKFDLSSVSAINSVKLDLFGKLSDTQDASITTSLFSVADTSWSETGVTFNNAPALSNTALGSATVTGTSLQMVQFDVTAYVKAQFAAGHKVVSFALKDLSSSNSFIQFNSREAGSQTPQLVVS
jgi:uncharacterized delta-60 repeat protein